MYVLNIIIKWRKWFARKASKCRRSSNWWLTTTLEVRLRPLRTPDPPPEPIPRREISHVRAAAGAQRRPHCAEYGLKSLREEQIRLLPRRTLRGARNVSGGRAQDHRPFLPARALVTLYGLVDVRVRHLLPSELQEKVEGLQRRICKYWDCLLRELTRGKDDDPIPSPIRRIKKEERSRRRGVNCKIAK